MFNTSLYQQCYLDFVLSCLYLTLLTDPQLQQALDTSVWEQRRKEAQDQTYRGRLNQNLDELQYDIRAEVPADGNCFYNAMADQMVRLNMVPLTHSQLRQNVVNLLKNLVRK